MNLKTQGSQWENTEIPKILRVSQEIPPNPTPWKYLKPSLEMMHSGMQFYMLVTIFLYIFTGF